MLLLLRIYFYDVLPHKHVTVSDKIRINEVFSYSVDIIIRTKQYNSI